MDSESEIGRWLIKEARLSFRYWHSSASLRHNLKQPYFDRNQCQDILSKYKEVTPQRLA